MTTCEAFVSLTRDSDVFVLLLSCATLVRAKLCCSVKGTIQTIIWKLHFFLAIYSLRSSLHFKNTVMGFVMGDDSSQIYCLFNQQNNFQLR